jgi:hypothetical protein
MLTRNTLVVALLLCWAVAGLQARSHPRDSHRGAGMGRVHGAREQGTAAKHRQHSGRHVVAKDAVMDVGDIATLVAGTDDPRHHHFKKKGDRHNSGAGDTKDGNHPTVGRTSVTKRLHHHHSDKSLFGNTRREILLPPNVDRRRHH